MRGRAPSVLLAGLLLLGLAAGVAAFLLPPGPAGAAPHHQRQPQRQQQRRWATGAGDDEAAAGDSTNGQSMLPQRRQRRESNGDGRRDAATRNEALRRVGLMGLGAMMLGARPVEALQGGTGAMSLIDPGEGGIKEPSGRERFLDFLQEVKIELVGAKEEFEELVPDEVKRLTKAMDPVGAEKAYFALGCYWGAEATFRCTKDVVATRVGFMGGKQPAPYYEDTKDHLEALEITYVGGDATYERLLKVAGRTFDFVDIGPRYARKIWVASNGQRVLATRKGQTWSPMPIGEASETFFTPAKLDHQAYSKPRCDGAAPNRQLVMNGLARKIDHYHYASDCPTCTLPSDPEESGFGLGKKKGAAAASSS